MRGRPPPSPPLDWNVPDVCFFLDRPSEMFWTREVTGLCPCLPFSPGRRSYRVTVGNKTCMFEKEKDPTVLRSPSAGKLLQYIVEDGGHICAGQPYAEIEVSHLACCHPVSQPGRCF